MGDQTLETLFQGKQELQFLSWYFVWIWSDYERWQGFSERVGKVGVTVKVDTNSPIIVGIECSEFKSCYLIPYGTTFKNVLLDDLPISEKRFIIRKLNPS